MTTSTTTGSLRSFTMGVLLTVTSLSLSANYAIYSGRIGIEHARTTMQATTLPSKTSSSVMSSNAKEEITELFPQYGVGK